MCEMGYLGRARLTSCGIGTCVGHAREREGESEREKERDVETERVRARERKRWGEKD